MLNFLVRVVAEPGRGLSRRMDLVIGSGVVTVGSDAQLLFAAAVSLHFWLRRSCPGFKRLFIPSDERDLERSQWKSASEFNSVLPTRARILRGV